MIFKREPAMILAVVQAVLALVLAFGVELTVAQTGTILAVTAAVLGLVVRSAVTPTVTDPVSVVNPPE